MDKAEEMYGYSLKIKELYYGEESELLIGVLKSLAQVQSMQDQNDMAVETLERALVIAKKILDAKTSKDEKALKDSASECAFLILQIKDAVKNPLPVAKLEQLAEFIKTINGEKSSPYAYFLFL